MNPYSPFHIIEQENAPKELNCIVEIPAGERYLKYEFNKEYGVLEVDRALPGPTFYPVNYCDVPQTWNEGDDDPLDVVMFASGPIHPGVMVKGRVIGMMEMDDTGEVDHKIVCVAAADPRYDEVKHIDDLRPFEKADIKNFMEMYKIPTKGNVVKVGKFLGPEDAYKMIEESLEAYKKKFPKEA